MRAFLFLFFLLSAQAQAGPALQVANPWVRAMPPGSPNTAAYLSLSNTSAEAIKVIGVSTSAATRVEVHRSQNEGGVWRMQALQALSVAAGETLALEPGATHLMVFDLTQVLREGEQIKFVLQLQGGEKVPFTATVRSAASISGQGHH
jgi:copper(I)-binding protein